MHATTGRRISSFTKILGMVLVFSIGLAAVTGLIALRQYQAGYANFMKSYRQSLFSDFDTDIASNCHMAAESSNRVSATAKNGAGIVEGTIEGMRRIAGKARGTAQVADPLGTRSDPDRSRISVHIKSQMVSGRVKKERQVCTVMMAAMLS